jgi:hypothetical protein
LDEFSKGRGARARLAGLRDAITAIAPDYRGLEDVFDKNLMAFVIANAAERARIVAFLKSHWFDAASAEAFFPGVPMARIYAEGVLKALEFSLNARRAVPLNAWWLIGFPEPQMLTLADTNDAGMTVGGRVTLLVLTPRPQGDHRVSATPILGDAAQAWVSEHRGNRVTTRSLRPA